MVGDAESQEAVHEMFKRACFVTQLVAVSVHCAEQAGNIIKVMLQSLTLRHYHL